MTYASGYEVAHDAIASSDEKSPPHSSSEKTTTSKLDEAIIKEILHAIDGLQFGEVTIEVREGRVVRIERCARVRKLLSKQTK